MRQVSITSKAVTADCGLNPGDLRENIVVDFEGLYELPSGTVVKIGPALIRLTFHCEPCKKIMHLIALDRIAHKRGFLGCFLNSGSIKLGHPMIVTDQRLDEIPYGMTDRLQWFLKRWDAPLAAREIAHQLGLPSYYARAIPRLLHKAAVGTRSGRG